MYIYIYLYIFTYTNRSYFCKFDIWSKYQVYPIPSKLSSYKADHEEIAAKAPELLDALQHAEVGLAVWPPRFGRDIWSKVDWNTIGLIQMASKHVPLQR